MEPSSAQATLAHYWDDAADALAGNQNSSATTTDPTAPSEPSILQTILYGAAGVVAFFWLVHWANVWRRTRREKAFNLELRRRHGIPDSDTRPFNVAYQAASIAARESARQSQTEEPEIQPKQTVSRNVSLSHANIKEGFRPLARSRPPIPQFPGQTATRVPSGSFDFGYSAPLQQTPSLDSTRAYSQLPNVAGSTSGSWGPRYAAENFRATSVPAVPTVSSRSAFAVAAASGSLRASNTFTSNSGTGDRRVWQNSARLALSRANGNSQVRSRKRLYLTADEEAEDQETTPNDKRSRTAGWGADDMIDGDNEPTWAQSYPVDAQPVLESRATQTGKTKGKRPADDGEGDLRTDGKRRQTKSSKQRSNPSDLPEKRGTKRERKEVDTASVLNDVMPVHKRGRAGDVDLSIVKEEELDDEEDPNVSRDPLCNGRKIGQKWTSNGQEYMVGPNGDRLRLVTVKESRKKYFMPADSKHADNFHMVDVFVEKWLTEEQYVRAKADGQLAWQENENLPSPVKRESPEKVLEGKENQTEEERPRVTAIALRARTANSVWNTPGQSPLTANDPHMNPFTTASAPQSPGPRRVKYTIGTVPAAALNASRMMSNWEKQEREAQALKMLRERKAAEAAANAPPKPAPTPVAVPSISLTPSVSIPTPSTPAQAPEIKVIAPTPGSSISASLLPQAPSSDGKLSPFGFISTPKPAEPAAPASNIFSFGASKKEEPAKPVFTTTPAPVAEAPKTAAPSLFPPTSTTTTANTSLFNAPAATPAPAAPKPSPFGAPTSAPAPATQTKPSPFAFGAPSTAPKPAATTLNANTNTNTTASPFGTTPASTGFGPTAPAPAPSPFGATSAAPAPAATKPSGFAFGAVPAAPAAPANTNVFGAQAPAKPASSGFSFGGGNSATTGSSEAKPAGTFSFGATPSTTAAPVSTTSSGFGTNSNTTGGATPSLFAFGAAPKSAAPAPTTSGFGAQPAAPASNTFKFGGMNTVTNGTSGTNSGFSFGAAAPKPTVSIPATNAFSAPPTATPTTTTTPFAFGANTNANVAASPATPSKPLFNMGAPTASPVMGNRQISTSKRVQRAISKPPQ
ncbi:Zinc finger protein DZIP1L [Rhizoctonia solani]|uniref:Zinc finger protein DZIP1L n=1 Tax=Rhizoctonia solani TaxID=456999 RepID=A0A0K6FW10_9AGAM|nr:Zinc finger protein DZIP1L [Rhizoctonia solani]